MTSEMTFTYQTRFYLDDRQETIMQECARLLNKVERSLYAETAKGKKASSCKNAFLKIYGITARQFNACRVSLEGKISACQASICQAISSIKQQLDCLEKKIKQLQNKPSKHFVLHQKKRRKEVLSKRLFRLKEDQERQIVRLCFGGKKLFRAQFHLEENGFSSHEEWKKAWEAKRNNEFFILGSKDETAGNQTCQAILKEKGMSLKLRLPIALEEKFGKYLEIENVNFAYGQDVVLASLRDKKALCYRFKRDGKSWKVFVSTAFTKVETLSNAKSGVIGIDLNSDHIAYVETDRFGNPIDRKIFPWIAYGKNRNQLKALTGDLCKKIIEKAKETQKPLVIENLDFQKKKLSLEEKGSKFARLLSSFAYGLFFSFLKSRCYKSGIAIFSVNPAFTSVIGRINFAKRYGLSFHLAAALCIARRYQKFSESPVSSPAKISDGKEGHVAFTLPVRNRAKHVWHFWGQVKKKLKTVLAAHFRAT